MREEKRDQVATAVNYAWRLFDDVMRINSGSEPVEPVDRVRIDLLKVLHLPAFKKCRSPLMGEPCPFYGPGGKYEAIGQEEFNFPEGLVRFSGKLMTHYWEAEEIGKAVAAIDSFYRNGSAEGTLYLRGVEAGLAALDDIAGCEFCGGGEIVERDTITHDQRVDMVWTYHQNIYQSVAIPMPGSLAAIKSRKVIDLLLRDSYPDDPRNQNALRVSGIPSEQRFREVQEALLDMERDSLYA